MAVNMTTKWPESHKAATYAINPCPKPRMTQSDRWKKRPAVLRYWAFCEQVRLSRVELHYEGDTIIFILPMPDSWSKKKRADMDGQPHQQRPDLSNLIKALEDACYGEDAAIWHYAGLEKRWGYVGEIIIQNRGN